MATATILIKRWTGSSGSPTKTDITSQNTRCNAADDPSPGSTNPVIIPSVGTNYSYWCVTRLNCSSNASSHTINNLKWYTDGSNSFGTGIACNVATATTYVQATGTTGTTGDLLDSSNYPTLLTTPVDAFTCTSSNVLPVSGSISSTGDFGNFVVYQFAISTTASAGASAQETFTWSYDEA